MRAVRSSIDDAILSGFFNKVHVGGFGEQLAEKALPAVLYLMCRRYVDLQLP